MYNTMYRGRTWAKGTIMTQKIKIFFQSYFVTKTGVKLRVNKFSFSFYSDVLKFYTL